MARVGTILINHKITLHRMSDRLRRRKSPPRGRSKSRAKSRGRSPSPPLEFKETSTRIVRKYATQTQSYQDHYSGQASRSDAIEHHDEESDQDDFDGSYLCRLRKREIIDSIGQLAEPQSELHDLVKEYREVDEEERDYDNDDNSWGENSDDDKETDESEYDNEESETDYIDSEDGDHDDNDKTHDEKEKN